MELYLKLVRSLGEKRSEEILGIVKGQLEACPNVKIYVTEEDLPLAINILEGRSVLIRFVHLNAPIGVFIRSKKVADFYTKYFEELRADAVPISKYLNIR
jgi:hypothetical protein